MMKLGSGTDKLRPSNLAILRLKVAFSLPYRHSCRQLALHDCSLHEQALPPHSQVHRIMHQADLKHQVALIVLLMNLEVTLWMCTYWANLRCLSTNYDMTAVAALPYLYLALFKYLRSLDVL